MTGRGLRRLLVHLLVAAVTVSCIALGFWQLGRMRGLQERNDLLTERLAAEPRPYEGLVDGLDPDAPAGSERDARHRPVVVTGTFDPEHEVLLRSRSYQERPGYHVLTPLRLDGAGRALLIDRGWIPYRFDGTDGSSYAPPAGSVRVTGRLVPEADPPQGFLAGLAPRDPPTGPLERVARPDVDRLQDQMPYALEPFIVEMEEVARPPATEPGAAPGAASSGAEAAGDAPSAGQGADGETDLPIVPPRPGPESGPHLGYAIQWFSFAAIAAGGYALLLRRDAREPGEAAEGEAQGDRPAGGRGAR